MKIQKKKQRSGSHTHRRRKPFFGDRPFILFDFKQKKLIDCLRFALVKQPCKLSFRQTNMYLREGMLTTLLLQTRDPFNIVEHAGQLACRPYRFYLAPLFGFFNHVPIESIA